MAKRSTIHANLYLDANVYLTFYHFTKEDLTSLHKLVTFIESGNVVVYVPEQTINEFRRNRETKISDAMGKLRESRLNDSFPRLAFQYEELSAMKYAIREYEQNKNELLQKIQSDAETGTLKADDVINLLFEKATKIETTEEIYAKAIMRFNLGNPPGKQRSYGDALNWESLLAAVPEHEDLHFISEDSDFFSKLNSENFNSFLLNEWKEVKSSELHFYKTLTPFLKNNLPEIEIGSETAKDVVIMNLSAAGSFAKAKEVIYKLRDYDNFSVAQLNSIAEAFASNNQIYSIGNDYVVRQARYEIIEKNAKKIDVELFNKYKRRYE
jgi:hypothetical protein